LIIGPEFFNVARFVVFTVEVVRVECLDGGKNLVVFLVHEMPVSTLSVPGIEAVIANHSKCFGGQ
jgi:hypothetical protein